MLTVLSIVGTRPEAVKMAPIIRELSRHSDRVRSIVCDTGQHRELLDPVLALFQIRPDCRLEVMQRDQQLAALTAMLFSRLDDVMARVAPEWVLAQGDTTSVMVAAMVAYYRKVRFGHVEAGLRTADLYQPFPEEANRRVADSLASLLFAPTERNRRTLLDEGIPDCRIVVTGNTVVDALHQVDIDGYDWAAGPLHALPREKRLVLITAHRRESFGEPFIELCLAIRDLATRYEGDGTHFVYPVHLNPNVRRPVGELLSDVRNVSLLDPLDYMAMLALMKRSTLILTDSGGIQEEAPSLGVPVLVMRDVTERPEGVDAGASRVVGRTRAGIVGEVVRLLDHPDERQRMIVPRNPYGDGHAASRIVAALLDSNRDAAA